MRMSRFIGVSALALLQLSVASVAFAEIFPDVPDNFIYREPIEKLVGLKVINGNPDGKFYPMRSVNRAELLTMLYRAMGKTPAAVTASCFRDVQKGSWYEAVVCDAAASHTVEGYNDGSFRPEKEVNRVESIKMITKMFGIPVGNVTDQDRSVVKFVDVSLSAWYTKYLYAAFNTGILPIAGQVGPRFFPDAALLRGEAAAYISNALPFIDASLRQEALSSAASVTASASSTGAQSSAGVAGSAPAAATSSASTFTLPEPVVKQVTFPFSDQGTFDGKRVISERFTLTAVTVADVRVAVGDTDARVTCRLFKLADQGISDEYYIGFQLNNTCGMRVTLGAGVYQLDVQPSVEDETYTLTAKAGKSDGNDGFREAKILTKGTPRSAQMTVDDFADFYTFTVKQPTTMTLQMSTATSMDATINPMADVDLFGFSGPVTNVPYLYPAGTYYVVVRRGDPAAGKVTYTIQLK